MTTALYARISDDREGKALGVARQVKDCKAKAKALGWPEPVEYVDNSLSASKDVLRPAYERLMADIKAGTVKALVVYDLDRLTRKPAELEAFIDLANLHKTELANVSGNVDLTTSDGRMHARFKGVLAKQESERISERVKRKQLQRAEEGVKKQGRFRTFGYNRDMTPHDQEAPLVKEVYTRKATGESLTSIAGDLNERGFTTTGGGYWDASAVSKVIKRRDYIGEIVLNGVVVSTAAFEPLVERALFDLANSETEKKNNRGNNARTSLLAGFVVCGNCDNKMKSGGGKGGKNYRCPGNIPGSCGSCSIVGPDTDAAVFQAAYEKEQTEPVEAAESVRDYTAEAKVIEDEIEAVRADYKSGVLLYVDYVPVINTARERLAKLQREEASDVKTDLGALQLPMVDWVNWSLSQQRLFLERHIALVVIAKADRVGIKGYKPERVTVHFKDGEVRQLARGIVVDSSHSIPAKTCTVDGCDQPYEARDMCQKHYRASRRALAKGRSA